MRKTHLAFAAAIVVQLGILAAIPARKVIARAQGTAVTLRTRPVDPYDLLSGYYVTLSYEIERPPQELRPPGDPDRVWLVVERDTPAWRLVSVETVRPASLAGDRAAIRARWNGYWATLEGAGRLYIPEARREEVDAKMREVGGKGLVDLKVGPGGEPAVIQLRIGGETFGG